MVTILIQERNLIIFAKSFKKGNGTSTNITTHGYIFDFSDFYEFISII